MTESRPRLRGLWMEQRGLFEALVLLLVVVISIAAEVMTPVSNLTERSAVQTTALIRQ